MAAFTLEILERSRRNLCPRNLPQGCLKIKTQSSRPMAQAHQLAAIQDASHLREPSCSPSMARAAAAEEGTQ
jgi:hypothetical protein